jgi:hypothetical protein
MRTPAACNSSWSSSICSSFDTVTVMQSSSKSSAMSQGHCTLAPHICLHTTSLDDIVETFVLVKQKLAELLREVPRRSTRQLSTDGKQTKRQESCCVSKCVGRRFFSQHTTNTTK